MRFRATAVCKGCASVALDAPSAPCWVSKGRLQRCIRQRRQACAPVLPGCSGSPARPGVPRWCLDRLRSAGRRLPRAVLPPQARTRAAARGGRERPIRGRGSGVSRHAVAAGGGAEKRLAGCGDERKAHGDPRTSPAPATTATRGGARCHHPVRAVEIRGGRTTPSTGLWELEESELHPLVRSHVARRRRPRDATLIGGFTGQR